VCIGDFESDEKEVRRRKHDCEQVRDCEAGERGGF
jgi:hypothetical protein